jgi:hypothetical protein
MVNDGRAEFFALPICSFGPMASLSFQGIDFVRASLRLSR